MQITNFKLNDELNEVGIYVNSTGNSWEKCHPNLKIDDANKLIVQRKVPFKEASSSASTSSQKTIEPSQAKQKQKVPIIFTSPAASSSKNEAAKAKWGQKGVARLTLTMPASSKRSAETAQTKGGQKLQRLLLSQKGNEIVQAKWGQKVPGLYTYFEIAIDCGDCFFVGVSPLLNANLGVNLCELPSAIAYKSNGGFCANGDDIIRHGEEKPKSQSEIAYGAGDMVGFGYNANAYFGTKNGELIWTHNNLVRSATNDAKLFPTISFCGFGNAKIKANFGENPFQFDVANYVLSNFLL
ncbi:hypothetical protein niasHT_010132 [Heterodera trifolii]|uniref:B30.2/SPRY domain-containing protein n=1 Tax=Heterodera trifolii TaxID=157864 RepID=A0ABD2LWM6_9BILA